MSKTNLINNTTWELILDRHIAKKKSINNENSNFIKRTKKFMKGGKFASLQS
jgi:hypothetical protein